jgi:hypothetical protein
MATIVMDSAKVIKACEATIKHIKDTQKKRDGYSISVVMAEKRGWFKKYYPTREQAIKILDESNMFGWRSGYAWGDLEKAGKLLKLAQLGDPVTLNEEDVRVIF